MSDYNVLDYGAIGNGTTLDTQAIQAAIDACASAGGGRVIIPAGMRFLSGTLWIKPQVELHIERGAVLQASGDIRDYAVVPLSDMTSWGMGDGTQVIQPQDEAFYAFIIGVNAHYAAFSGAGTIDASGRAFIDHELPHIYRMKRERPFTFFIIESHHLDFRDVTIHDAALWTVRLTGCEDVTIHAIRILNDLKLPNNDGIDLDHCRNVRISDCHIACGDDCIVLKTCLHDPRFGPCENITVTGCTLQSLSSALVIGCEAHQPMRNVIFDSCVVQASHRGLAIRLSHESDVENVIFSNMVVETRLYHSDWWGRGEPLYITSIPWTAQDTAGRVRHVRFSNILCRSENGVYVQGWDESRVEDILFENVRVELDKWTDVPGGEHDIRPAPVQGVYEHATAGFFIKNARDVRLRQCEVVWGQHVPDYFRHALEAHNVHGLVLENFRGEAAFPQRAPARLLDEATVLG